MKKPLRKLSTRPPMVEVVRDAILESICNGQLKAGERLGQARIAKMLHVSCQPVAQALGVLKTQGFVCDAGRRGLMVAPLDIDFVAELYEYRSALEPVLARKAADTGISPENAGP